MVVAPLIAAAALACPAAPVHYEWNRLSPADAWVVSGEGSNGLVGQLLGTYEPTLGDRRVREAAGLTLYAGALHKVAWLPRRWEGTAKTLVVAGRRVDGPGSFRLRFPRALAPQFYPSGIRLPIAGCWRLSLTSGSRRWTLYVRAIDPPAEPQCDATAVRDGMNPVDHTFTTWIATTPSSAGIYGTFSVSLPGVDGAAIYAGGRFPDGLTNTKVLWLVRNPSGLLTAVGTRLDARGTFRQTVSPAASPVYAYPSVLVVPEPGCWLLRLRTSGRGGVIVMRALAP